MHALAGHLSDRRHQVLVQLPAVDADGTFVREAQRSGLRLQGEGLDEDRDRGQPVGDHDLRHRVAAAAVSLQGVHPAESRRQGVDLPPELVQIGRGGRMAFDAPIAVGARVARSKQGLVDRTTDGELREGEALHHLAAPVECLGRDEQPGLHVRAELVPVAQVVLRHQDDRLAFAPGGPFQAALADVVLLADPRYVRVPQRKRLRAHAALDFYRHARREIALDLVVHPDDLARCSVEGLETLVHPVGVDDPRDTRGLDFFVVLVDERAPVAQVFARRVDPLQPLRRVAPGIGFGLCDIEQ
jgi:hypothetical protein